MHRFPLLRPRIRFADNDFNQRESQGYVHMLKEKTHLSYKWCFQITNLNIKLRLYAVFSKFCVYVTPNNIKVARQRLNPARESNQEPKAEYIPSTWKMDTTNIGNCNAGWLCVSVPRWARCSSRQPLVCLVCIR